MLSALVFGLFFTQAHAEGISDLIVKNPAFEKLIKATEDAAEIECYTQVADPASVVQKDGNGMPIVWKVIIPCRLRESVGAELENLELIYSIKNDKPVLYTSELRVPNKK